MMKILLGIVGGVAITVLLSKLTQRNKTKMENYTIIKSKHKCVVPCIATERNKDRYSNGEQLKIYVIPKGAILGLTDDLNDFMDKYDQTHLFWGDTAITMTWWQFTRCFEVLKDNDNKEE